MTKENIEQIIKQVCILFYKNHKHLIDERANERNIVSSYIAPDLRLKFIGYNVDAEYNREGKIGDRKTKTDIVGDPILPDIVIHKFGPKGKNLVAIEVKGYWNQEPREEDEKVLRRLEKKHNYEFLYRLELTRDKAELIEVSKIDPVAKI